MGRVLERWGEQQKAELKLQQWNAPVCIQQVQALLRQRGGNQECKAEQLKIGQQ